LIGQSLSVWSNIPCGLPAIIEILGPAGAATSSKDRWIRAYYFIGNQGCPNKVMKRGKYCCHGFN